MINDAIGLYKDSPMGEHAKISLQDFASKIKGVSTDHAEDQKKLVCLIREWKQICDREARGENVLDSAALAEVLPLVQQANKKKICDVGGASAWDVLSATEQKEINSKTHRNLCIELGEKAFPRLSVEEQQGIDFLIWAGCCMHKEMNLVKGGYAAISVAVVRFKTGPELDQPIFGPDRTILKLTIDHSCSMVCNWSVAVKTTVFN